MLAVRSLILEPPSPEESDRGLNKQLTQWVLSILLPTGLGLGLSSEEQAQGDSPSGIKRIAKFKVKPIPPSKNRYGDRSCKTEKEHSVLLCSHLSKTYSQVLSSDGWFIVKINHRAMHPLGPVSNSGCHDPTFMWTQ